MSLSSAGLSVRAFLNSAKVDRTLPLTEKSGRIQLLGRVEFLAYGSVALLDC